MKFILWNLILMLAIFGLADTGLALDQSGHFDPSSAPANEEAQEILEALLKRFSEPTYLSEHEFFSLISGLRESEKDLDSPEVFRELLAALLQRKKIHPNLSINYLPIDSAYITDKKIWGYHGTRAMLDILEEGHLVGRTAKCGRFGIFLGRQFHIADPYLSDRSSNIHSTWSPKYGIVRGILILKRDGQAVFEKSDAGFAGLVREYVLRQEKYDLDNLEALYFKTEEGAQKFGDFLSSSPDFMTRYASLPVYVEEYLPLKEPAIFNLFSTLVRSHWPKMLENPSWLKYLAKEFGPQFFNHQSLLQGLISSLPEEGIVPLLENAVEHVFEDVGLLAQLSALSKPKELLDSLEKAILRRNMNAVQAIVGSVCADSEAKIYVGNKLIESWDSLSLSEPKKMGEKKAQILRILADVFAPDFPTKFILSALDFYKIEPNLLTRLVPREELFQKIPHFLLAAIKKKKYTLVNELVLENPDRLQLQDKNNNNALLLLASAKNQSNRFKSYADMNLEMLNYSNNKLENCAHRAGQAGNREILEYLAEKSPALFMKLDSRGNIPLNYLLQEPTMIEATKIIASKFPETLSMRNKLGWTPMTIAVHHQNTEILRFFCQSYPGLVAQELEQIRKIVTDREYKDVHKVLEEFGF